jgi:hypothetical protein
MKKIVLLALILLTSCELTPPARADEPAGGSEARDIYIDAGLAGEVSFEAFERAFAGYNSVPDRGRNVLTIIDFTLPSTQQRLWVIDMTQRRVLFHTLVAHGQGSGENYATRFSNRSGSHQSSLGLFLTGATYTGGNGYSMTLDGLEPGVNDNARARSVVVHGAAYVSPSVIASAGRLGRSWGCPALPLDQTRPVIDAIKNGSVLYIYGHNEFGV